MLWVRVAKYVLWKAEEKWRARGCGLPFGGQHDDEHVLRGMMWADNYWQRQQGEIDLHGERRHRGAAVSGHETKAGITVVDKCTQTQGHEDLACGSRDSAWDLSLCEVFESLGYRFHRDGKCSRAAEHTMCKALRSWWRDKCIYRVKTVPMTAQCKRVHSHVYSTVLNGSSNWRWSGAMINKVCAWEGQILRFSLQTTNEAGRNLGGPQNKKVTVSTKQLEEGGLAVTNRENWK